MSAPGTFERVYSAIRQRLRDGRYPPGARLEPATLSMELNASVTPVRDALHRMTGERLVEAPRHEGFRVPAMTESTLRHLYAWHRDLLVLALLDRSARMAAPPPAAPEAPGERLGGLFLILAQASGNPEHVAALRSATERLEAVHRLEESFLDAVEKEADEILAAIRTGNRRALRKSLLYYHRRRERIVPALVERLQEGTGSADERS